MNKFGYPESEWDAAKTEAKQAMIERAKSRGLIPYSELVEHIHTIRGIEARDPRLFSLLGQISIEEDKVGHGMLSAVVVRNTDKLPGIGFFDLAKSLGHNVANEVEFWVAELNKVYAYWSNS